MTAEAVCISITIKVEELVVEFQETVPLGAVEDTIRRMSLAYRLRVRTFTRHPVWARPSMLPSARASTPTSRLPSRP